jgi:hypothetical protein
MQVVIPTGLLLLVSCSSRAADNNPLLGDWEYDSQDRDCPIAQGAPPMLVKIHFRKDSETDEFRAASSGPTDKYGQASTQTTPIKQYVIVPSDPVVSIIGTGGYTRWIVVDANHIKSDTPCHAVYRRVK